MAISCWVRSQMGARLTEEERRACRSLGIDPNARELEIGLFSTADRDHLAEAARSAHPEYARRAMSAVVGPTGGYLVAPERMVQNIEFAMLEYGSVMQSAEVIRTRTGEPYSWPTLNRVMIKGRRITENRPVATDKTLPLGKQTWQSWKYTSDAFLVPHELIEDASLANGLPDVIGAAIGERIGRVAEEELTNGDGASMPEGIVPGATLGVTAASQTAFTADELIDMQHSVDPAYRMNAAWMMHDQVCKLVRKLKDGQGQYLWQPGLQQGVPDQLLGSPVRRNQEMASILTAGETAMLYGDLKKYKVRQVNGIRIYRLQERFRENDQDGFVGFTRMDGHLLDAGTNPIKKLKMAS